jgi:hypothetical protein
MGYPPACSRRTFGPANDHFVPALGQAIGEIAHVPTDAAVDRLVDE